MAEVERMVKEKITKDPEAERRAILDGFSRRGVMPSDLERFIGCPSAQFTPDNLVTLRDMLTSIEDGHATWSEYIEGTVAQTTEEIKEKSQPETKGKAVAEKLKTVAEERQVKQPEPTSEQQPEQPQQEPEPEKQKADEPAQQPATEGDRKLIANAVKGAELKLRSTVEGTQKLNKILASMKVRLSGKQVPLDVIPVEQHEFYLDKLDKAVNDLQK
jgi:hypothetical protein